MRKVGLFDLSCWIRLISSYGINQPLTKPSVIRFNGLFPELNQIRMNHIKIKNKNSYIVNKVCKNGALDTS